MAKAKMPDSSSLGFFEDRHMSAVRRKDEFRVRDGGSKDSGRPGRLQEVPLPTDDQRGATDLRQPAGHVNVGGEGTRKDLPAAQAPVGAVLDGQDTDAMTPSKNATVSLPRGSPLVS